MSADEHLAADTAWRSSNIGTLLLAASARIIATKLAVVHTRGFDVTEAQLALFHALDEDGSRLTALAARARLSKAAMVDLVDRAEAAGWTVRIEDSADRRAKLVELTAAGRALRAALADGIAAAELEVSRELGATAAAQFKNRLGAYIAAPPGAAPFALAPAGRATAAVPAASPVTVAWASANIGRALVLASQRFVLDVAALVAHEGFDASPALLGMIRHLDLSGTRLTEIAARARTTKQSMRELVTRAERLGYIVRLADAGDGRAWTIAFTARGRDLLDAVHRGVLAAETMMAAVIGQTEITHTRRDLKRVAVDPLAAAA